MTGMNMLYAMMLSSMTEGLVYPDQRDKPVPWTRQCLHGVSFSVSGMNVPHASMIQLQQELVISAEAYSH